MKVHLSRLKRVASEERSNLSSDVLCKILFVTENMARDQQTIPQWEKKSFDILFFVRIEPWSLVL